MKAVILESKVTTLIYNELDKIFDGLKLVRTDDELVQYNWLDVNDETAFERNHWGVLWIYDCDKYLDIRTLAKIFSMSFDDISPVIVSYLNKKYESEFKDKPIKGISSEDCIPWLEDA